MVEYGKVAKVPPYRKQKGAVAGHVRRSRGHRFHYDLVPTGTFVEPGHREVYRCGVCGASVLGTEHLLAARSPESREAWAIQQAIAGLTRKAIREAIEER